MEKNTFCKNNGTDLRSVLDFNLVMISVFKDHNSM